MDTYLWKQVQSGCEITTRTYVPMDGLHTTNRKHYTEETTIMRHALDRITLMGMMQKKTMYTSITDLTSKVVVKTRIKPRKKRGKKEQN